MDNIYSFVNKFLEKKNSEMMINNYFKKEMIDTFNNVDVYSLWIPVYPYSFF